MKLGLENLLENQLSLIRNARVGLIVNPASINQAYEHAADLFFNHQEINLTALFGPQHSIRGETQDNMIEWDGYRDRRTGIPVYSLYGKTRIPTEEMLAGVDVLVFDLQDVGTRIYTFIYTMAHAMQACAQFGKKMIVLDRPNPIGGTEVEGNLLEPEFASFVGLFPIPMRHGMTVAELAQLFNKEFGINCDLEVVLMQGWRREMWFDQTGVPWVIPSPNMPTLDTATVYPGTVLLEGTLVSEGRGTTRPFELIGAPYIEPDDLVAELKSYNLPGVVFRPHYFQPTFQKHANTLCGGLQLHVIDRAKFKPYITGIAIVRAIRMLYPNKFEWRQPPYEYVYDKMPFDILAGTDKLRKQIDAGAPLDEIEASWRADLSAFMNKREAYLLYS